MFTIQGYKPSPFIFKMVAMLQIPRVVLRVSCLGRARAVQYPCPGPNIGDKSQQIPRYSPVCPRGQPPGMGADKCIIGYTNIIDIIPIQWTSYYCGYHSVSRSQMTSADCHFEPAVAGPYPASDVTDARYWCLHQVSDWELSS